MKTKLEKTTVSLFPKHASYLSAGIIMMTAAPLALAEGPTFTSNITIDTQFPEIKFDQPTGNDPSIEIQSGRMEFEHVNASQTMFIELDTGQLSFGGSTSATEKPYHFRPTEADADAAILVDNDLQLTTTPRNMFELRNNGAPRFVLQDTSLGGAGITTNLYTFAMTPQGAFSLARAGVPGAEILIKQNGEIDMGPGTTTSFRVTGSGVEATTYQQLSDRDAKTDIEELSSDDILDKISQVPVSSWRFKGENDPGLHIGPMAQDFHKVFGTGKSERVISLGDLAGVALAGVHSLNEELEERDSTISDLSTRLDEEHARSADLEKRIGRLEALLEKR